MNTAAASKMTADFIDVTPKLAQAWLDTDKGNRHIRANKVAAYVRAMQSGRWRQTHQGVSFDEHGNLLDGQHRLTAIVRSGMTIRMLVTYNQPRDNMKVIDRGSARSTGDTLRIFYGLNNPTQRAATARIVISFRRGIFSGTYFADDDEVEAEILEHGGDYDWIFETFHKNKKFSSVVYAALAYAYPVAPQKVQEFAALIIEPANVPSGSIVFKAKEVAEASNHGKSGSARMETVRRMLRCIQAYLRDETLKMIKDSDEGLRYFAKLRGDAEPPKDAPR